MEESEVHDRQLLFIRIRHLFENVSRQSLIPSTVTKLVSKVSDHYHPCWRENLVTLESECVATLTK